MSIKTAVTGLRTSKKAATQGEFLYSTQNNGPNALFLFKKSMFISESLKKNYM
jgi:hypothetical protein